MKYKEKKIHGLEFWSCTPFTKEEDGLPLFPFFFGLLMFGLKLGLFSVFGFLSFVWTHGLGQIGHHNLLLTLSLIPKLLTMLTTSF